MIGASCPLIHEINCDNGNPIAFPVTVMQEEEEEKDSARRGGQLSCNEALVLFLDRLQTLEKIRSVDEERKVADWVKQLIPHLDNDRRDHDKRSEDRLAMLDYYRLALDGILRRVTMPVEEQAVQQLFLVAGDLEITAQSLESLLVFEEKQDFQRKMQLLAVLFRDEMVLSAALVDASFSSSSEGQEISGTHLSAINRDLTKDRFIARLVNVPTVIANFTAGTKQLEGSAAVFLASYETILYRNVLKAFLTLTTLKRPSHSVNYDFLCKLLSKVIINFASNRTSAVLERFLQIGCAIGRADDGAAATFRAAMTQLLGNVNSGHAIEAVLICLLNKCRNWSACLLPRQLFQQSADWRYVLTKSIPLRSYVRGERFPGQFVRFLVKCEENDADSEGGGGGGVEKKVVESVLLELLNCWSQSGGAERPLEQHIFISRLIIFLILTIEKERRMTAKLSSAIKQSVYNGMSAHLQSLDMHLRFVGMRMAEIVLNILENVSEEDRLDFGAAKLGVEKELLQMFERFDEEEEDQVPELDEETVLRGLEWNTGVKDEEQVTESKRTAPQLIIKKKSTEEQLLDSDDDDDDVMPLDEDDDDDLVPYDLSNDTSEQEAVAPKYLLDLKEVLVQSTDDKNNGQQFAAGVKVCADLIRSQLPLNDVRLGVELLSVLVTLQNKVYNEEFSEQRFEGCVAAVEVIPKEAAEFLCEEFYAEPGRYAISHRVLMLEVLSEAARRLSGIGRKEETEENRRKSPSIAYKKLATKDSELERRKEINRTITDRLAEKTRRFISSPNAGLPSKVLENRFHPVAGSFIFPLMHGFGSKQILFQSRNRLKDDTTNVLLLSFLKTLCALTLCSENAPQIRRIVQEVLHLIVLLKFYAEEKIQMCVLELVGCVMSVTPKQMMATDFLHSFLEIKAWLEDLLERNAFNPDMQKESMELAQRLLSFL